MDTKLEPTIPLDNGVRLMLIGCSKLERLEINLCGGALTDVGLGYIGKYGHILKYLYLGFVGECDLGLAELSKGCPKLRELGLTDYPCRRVNNKLFSMFDIHSLSLAKSAATQNLWPPPKAMKSDGTV
ncbi:nucleosome assembly protein 1,4 [Tanacetum coccineum]